MPIIKIPIETSSDPEKMQIWATEVVQVLFDINNQLEKSEKDNEEIKEDISKILQYIEGNGQPERGLIVRFDRIEQSYQRQKKFTMAALVAGITGFIGLIWDVLGKLIKL